MPINFTRRFAVKQQLFARKLLAHHNLAARVKRYQMKDCLAEINTDRV
jgi:hypothetical protein